MIGETIGGMTGVSNKGMARVYTGVDKGWMPVLAETAAAVSALSGGGWQAGHWVACVRGNSGVQSSTTFPDQTA